ncbi:hypothetical protein M440DRAFT_6232, partial [Trichoderma longibrachiatum ATCC 18648]
KDRAPQRSSSPFAPDSQRRATFRDAFSSSGAGVGGDNSKARKPAPSFQSAAATTVHSRISPLIMEKFQQLAKSYDEEWHEKDVAEAEARRILTNTQAELNLVRQQITELEAQLEPDDVAAKVMSEANLVRHNVLSLITHQNRLHIQQAVENEMSKLNGNASSSGGGDGGGSNSNNPNGAGTNSMQDDSYEERLALARQLSQMLMEQRQAETEYVDALSMVGVGDKIEKYRRLLKRCLDTKDGEVLDANLDSLIDMMEEEREVHDMDGSTTAGGEPMDFAVM